jgi:hypothetical protein
MSHIMFDRLNKSSRTAIWLHESNVSKVVKNCPHLTVVEYTH